MKTKSKLTTWRFILYLAIIFIVAILSYYLYEAGEFAQGVRTDTVKRDSLLNAKGIRLDSMGTVNFDDYKKIKDSLQLKDSIK